MKAQKQKALQVKTNILYITIDDLNDWIGCLDGHPQVKTPHIDRLAERGLLFTNAHCVVPACSGSRAANWTGLLPIHTGVYGNGQKIERTMPDAELLPLDLKKQGYYTMGTGKLLHGKSERMFDEYGPDYDKWMPILPDERTISKTELKDNRPYVRHEIPRLGITMPSIKCLGTANAGPAPSIRLTGDRSTGPTRNGRIHKAGLVEKLSQKYDQLLHACGRLLSPASAPLGAKTLSRYVST